MLNIFEPKYYHIYLVSMELYIKNYEFFNKSVVYNFNMRHGGIGDNIKYFMFILELCMKENKRLYYKKNNIDIEKYLKLKYDVMYVTDEMIKEMECVEIVCPFDFYSHPNYNEEWSINSNQVFYFTDEVKNNSKYLFPQDITNYISIHLRLGDKYLETEHAYIQCPMDTRSFSEEKIYKFIEEHHNENIYFCCDNNSYKIKLKEKYNNIIVTNSDIGHTSLLNTTSKQVLDAITEYYILTNSKAIYAGSKSGFSVTASKFNNILLINI